MDIKCVSRRYVVRDVSIGGNFFDKKIFSMSSGSSWLCRCVKLYCGMKY